ncbi:MAG: hypothetical protein WBA43_03655 [Elainellaceae cyanobacterium]
MSHPTAQTHNIQSQSLRRLLYQAVECHNAHPFVREVRSRLEDTQNSPSTQQH